jgi:hypothetical protein
VTDTTPTGEQIKEALVKLGETADEVAQALQQRGVRGVKGMARCCPVASYLTKEFPGIKGIGVTPVYVRVDVEGGEVYSFTSGATEDFIKRFDMGKYEGLVIPFEELAQIA